MKLILLIICFIVGLRSISAAQEPNTKYRSLECIEIVDPQFESILDSVLNQERARPYYREKLTFAIELTDKNELMIYAIGKSFFRESFKGVLQYKDHHFIISVDDWQSLDPQLFARTGRNIEEPFWITTSYMNEQGKLVIVITLENTKPYLYNYRDGEFISIPIPRGHM